MNNRFPDMANASGWVDLTELEHAWTKSGKKVDDEQAKEMGAGALSLR